MPALRTPISLVSLPGDKPFDTTAATPEGKYLLGHVLGEGGMGKVYAARDGDMGRTVALKTLRDEHVDEPSLVRALVFEARISGQLEHPHIVPVHELGTLPDGRIFYTMKLVSDTTLRDILRTLRDDVEDARERFTLNRLLQYLRGICMAVEYAHARGVIHRDLKPDNVLVGEFGEVQIMDWGVARILPTGSDGVGYFAGTEEETGVIIGTPHYMSPEQARGDTLHVGPRSDVYSLGVILYQMLTWALPYGTQTTSDQLEALLTRPIPPPRQRAPEREIPPELESICLKAVAYRPQDRFQSVRALWSEIEAFLEGRKEQKRLQELADAQLVVADAAASRYRRVRAELLHLEEAVRAEELNANPFDPLPVRKQRWERRTRVARKGLVEARTFAEAVTGFHRVLAHQPSNRSARQGLANLYTSQSEAAFDRGDEAAMVLYGELALSAGAMPGSGRGHRATATVNIRSYPEGAAIHVFELTGSDDPSDDDLAWRGTAPTSGVRLRPGVYVVAGSLPGYRDARVPIVLTEDGTQHVLVTLQAWSASLPIIGHSNVLAIVKEAFERSVAEGRLTSLCVLGDPGLGQGNLLADFDDYLDDLPETVFFSFVRCASSDMHVPFAAAGRILRHRAGVRDLDPDGVIQARFDDVLLRAFNANGSRTLSPQEVDEAVEIARLVTTLPSIVGRGVEHGAQDSPTARSRRVFDAVARFLEKIAEVSPIVLVLRGADRLDRLSRDLLVFLARRLATKPIFFLGLASRDAKLMPFDRLVQLKPHDRDGVSHQLSLLLKGAIGDELAELVTAKTAGNPFEIGELARIMSGQGWLAWDGRRWGIAWDAVGSYDLRAAEMDELMRLAMADISPGCRQLLEAAAIAGTTFWVDEAAERLDRDIEADLAELTARELVRPEPTSHFAHQREFRFRHLAIQRRLYDEAGPEGRAEQHAAIAEWLARHSSGALSDQSLVAHHYELAGDLDAAEPRRALLAAEAAVWEGTAGPDWGAWPRDIRSLIFDDIGPR